MNLIYKGSVKDLYKSGDGKIIFQYSNRYSIFDWGEMPDEIPLKGEALAVMAGMFFDYLSEKGISSHYLGQKNRNSIEVQAVDVLRPEWKEDRYDYGAYAHRPTQCLVPLEVIFRRHLGMGNSLHARLARNPAYAQDLGLNPIPTTDSSFAPALIEFSTKLESTDRYLSRAEIQAMHVVSEEELHGLKAHTQQVSQLMEDLFASFGVKLWDGKVEYAFRNDVNGQRELMLVDSIGPDELRLTYENLPLSKEFLRQIYAGSAWSEAVKKAKDLAQERKTQDWKKICIEELKQHPLPLTAAQIQVASYLYQALANEVAVALRRPTPFAPDVNLRFWFKKVQEMEPLS